MKLFLFDLDGTLVSTGGAGLRALSEAFNELYGIKDAVRLINPSGKTDPAIFREMAQLHLDQPLDDKQMARITESYLRHLEIQMKTSHGKGALDGVVDFIKHLSTLPDVVLALGTGNLEKGARLKLAPTPLNAYFEIGGFGSDAEERSDVLKFGHRRAEKKTNRVIAGDSVFVVGDTPLDISAARWAGFNVVAVASGNYSYEELENAKPDFVIRSMMDGFSLLEKLENRAKHE